MAYTYYDRLSATDATFLAIEDENVHMHVGAVALFERATLARDDGSLDVETLHRFVESALRTMPRFRQKVVQVPLVDERVWVDDERFNLDYHVRHTALPPPSDIRQLKRLAGRILSQKLDEHKPLWELWLVEAVEGDRFALIVKAHHAMVDGIGGMDLFASLLRLEPTASFPEPERWLPRPAPSATQLVTDELGRRAAMPWSALGAARDTLSHPLDTLQEVRESVAAVGDTISAGLAPSSETALNPEIGPYRRFDWTKTSIEEIREIRKHLGGTLNDVVLSVVAGAVARFLERRGERVDADMVFRAMVPVSLRTENERGKPGNRVVNFLAPLHVDERDPVRRLDRTSETLQELKESRLARGAEVIEEFADHGFTNVVVQFVRLAANARAYNIVVTNVPGPPRALHLLTAPMTDIFPVVPLFNNQGVGIALFSYNGQLSWGLNADWDATPDLHSLVEDLEVEIQDLLSAAKGT